MDYSDDKPRNKAGYTIDENETNPNNVHHREYGSLYRGTSYEAVDDYNRFLRESNYDR